MKGVKDSGRSCIFPSFVIVTELRENIYGNFMSPVNAMSRVEVMERTSDCLLMLEKGGTRVAHAKENTHESL